MKITKIFKYSLFAIAGILSIFAMAEQEKVVRIFKDGDIIKEYNIKDIDYIEVHDYIPAPEGMNATTENNAINLQWNAVNNAVYNVYRSGDNVNFTLIAQNLTENKYTDNSPLSGSNYYKIKAIVNGTESGFSTSVVAAIADSGLASGIYLGVFGFNQALYNQPITQLETSSIDGFNSFIDGLNKKNGTLLYYSVDQALNTLQSTSLPSDLSTAAIVTFTDGLDQGSLMKNNSYKNDSQYLGALNNRIKNEKVQGKDISAFSIGIRGNDVSDISQFQENLSKLASSKENAMEVSSMAEVNAKFQEIATKLSQSNYIQTINLKIPGISDGSIIRFTFDNVASAENSKLYIEGVFNLENYSLEDVEYHGMVSTSGSSIKGEVEDIFINFTFEGVHTDDNVLIKSDFTDEWIYVFANGGIWQKNSEFDKKENSEIVTKRSSAAIMLVLDCSSSLGDQFANVQSNAKGFIKTLYEAAGLNNDDPANPEKPDVTIYSTTPKDLSLAIWKDGTRYYLTEEQYKTANLSGASIEGLTVLSNMGNFIISLYDIQTNTTSVKYAMKYYENLLPDKDQATVISARYADINSALTRFGGTAFSRNSYDYYLTKTSYNSDYNYALDLYNSTGGNLSYVSYGLLRGVVPISSDTKIIWSDPRDLCLAVLKDGERYFIREKNSDLSLYDEIEGVAVIAGGKQFIIKLHNEQTGTVTVDAAMKLYLDILPDKDQAEIISLKYYDINSALTKFGGDKFSTSSNDYYLTKTSYNSEMNYVIDLSGNKGGYLAYYYFGYIRGIKTFD